MTTNVLLFLGHAPEYREGFLRSLSDHCNLTVCASSGVADSLISPSSRVGYKYIELNRYRLFNFYFQSGLTSIIESKDWDAIIMPLNVRDISRFLTILIYGKLIKPKLIWRGHIYGYSKNFIICSIRKFLLNKGVACLTYNQSIQSKVTLRHPKLKTYSFNNTHVFKDDFYQTPFLNSSKSCLNLLFIGRNTKRKNLSMLVALLNQYDFINLRLIGQGCTSIDHSFLKPNALNRLSLYEYIADSKDLIPHIQWTDSFICSGDVGLLVLTAAKYYRPIIVSSDSPNHGPEFELAVESSQPIVSFTDNIQFSKLLSKLNSNREYLTTYASTLSDLAKKKFTIENMVSSHLQAIYEIKS